MDGIYSFFAGITITAALVSASLIYLHPNLRTILSELCGTAERAKFWVAFSNITLFLTPLIFALYAQPRNGSPSQLIYEASGQIASALIGLVAAVAILGVVISRFIARGLQPFAPAAPASGDQKSQR